MTLLDKLFFKEFIGIFLLSWLIFSFLVWLFLFLGNIFLFLDSPLSFYQHFLIDIKSLPSWLNQCLPISWLFSLSVAVAVLKTNGEWLGIWGAGVSTKRILLPYVFLALFLGFFSLIWQDFVALPLAEKRNQQREKKLGFYNETQDFILVDKNQKTILWAKNFNYEERTIQSPCVFCFDEKGSLLWSLEASSGCLTPAKTWLFQHVRLWNVQNGYAQLSRYEKLEEKFLKISLSSLALARSNWQFCSLAYLFKNLWLMEEEDKKAPVSLSTEVISRLLNSFSYLIMLFWSFWFAIRWSSNNLLFILMGSLSFNLVYTILHIVLVQLSLFGIISPFFLAWCELAFWVALLWFLYAYYEI